MATLNIDDIIDRGAARILAHPFTVANGKFKAAILHLHQHPLDPAALDNAIQAGAAASDVCPAPGGTPGIYREGAIREFAAAPNLIEAMAQTDVANARVAEATLETVRSQRVNPYKDLPK